jgi:hypothetical protein
VNLKFEKEVRRADRAFPNEKRESEREFAVEIASVTKMGGLRQWKAGNPRMDHQTGGF